MLWLLRLLGDDAKMGTPNRFTVGWIKRYEKDRHRDRETRKEMTHSWEDGDKGNR